MRHENWYLGVGLLLISTVASSAAPFKISQTGRQIDKLIDPVAALQYKTYDFTPMKVEGFSYPRFNVTIKRTVTKGSVKVTYLADVTYKSNGWKAAPISYTVTLLRGPTALNTFTVNTTNVGCNTETHQYSGDIPNSGNTDTNDYFSIFDGIRIEAQGGAEAC